MIDGVDKNSDEHQSYITKYGLIGKIDIRFVENKQAYSKYR